jgi:hypothetical protein
MFLRFILVFFIAAAGLLAGTPAHASETPGSAGATHFDQLGPLLDTPTETRLASGAPGPAYWQQRADYVIAVRLDDEQQRVEGEETITYHNRSPHTLRYLWLQLDQNHFEPDSDAVLTRDTRSMEKLGYRRVGEMLARERFDGGVRIAYLRDASGADLPLHDQQDDAAHRPAATARCRGQHELFPRLVAPDRRRHGDQGAGRL